MTKETSMMTRLFAGATLLSLLFWSATNAQQEEPKVKITDEKVGEGAEAKKGDTLQVHYTGWLKDKTKFDSSKDRDTPFEFKLGAGQVIQGWDKGMVGMKVG